MNVNSLVVKAAGVIKTFRRFFICLNSLRTFCCNVIRNEN